jgi:hypothetical protein
MPARIAEAPREVAKQLIADGMANKGDDLSNGAAKRRFGN